MYYFQDKDEGFSEDKITARDKIMAGCLKCVDFLCVWDCCWCWVRIQEIFALIVFDPFMELFITLCIVVNTLFMAMDHHDMDHDFEKVLKAGNYVSLGEISFVGQDTNSLILLFWGTVFHCNFCHRSFSEVTSFKPKVLLP